MQLRAEVNPCSGRGLLPRIDQAAKTLTWITDRGVPRY
jgi:hypothetical protein